MSECLVPVGMVEKGAEALTRFFPSSSAFGRVYVSRLSKAVLSAAGVPELLGEVERLREDIASALTSLETGPLTDGYAAGVLRAALSPREGR